MNAQNNRVEGNGVMAPILSASTSVTAITIHDTIWENKMDAANSEHSPTGSTRSEVEAI